MPSRALGFALVFVLLLTGQASAAPQTSASPSPARRLRVGITGSPPWVVRTPGRDELDGFSVRLWQAVATKLDLEYDFVHERTLEDMLADVVESKIDIGVGPVGITSARARKIAFSQPYFNASLGILTFSQPRTPWERARPFLSTAFAVLVAGLLLVIFVVGNVIWALERRVNPGIPRDWPSGVANGMWMAIVTMTTVGYGDRVPMTSLGRIATGVWMLAAMVMVSTLTASLTTALTVTNLGTVTIKNAESLSGKRVAVVSDTVGETFAETFHASLLRAATLHEAIALLLDKRADALVFDEPTLRFYLRQHPDQDLTLLAASFDVQSFGYALPLRSPMVQDLNIALLGLAEAGTVRQLREMWFAASSAQMRDATALHPVATGVLPPTDTTPPAPTPTPAATPVGSP